jgi:hypothetical protein
MLTKRRIQIKQRTRNRACMKSTIALATIYPFQTARGLQLNADSVQFAQSQVSGTDAIPQVWLMHPDRSGGKWIPVSQIPPALLPAVK